jgi:hypothetical protein
MRLLTFQSLRGVATKIGSFLDLEKGRTEPESSGESITVTAANDNLPRDTQVREVLCKFRNSVGIHHDADMTSGRLVPNLGLYQRIVKQEQMYEKQYKTWSFMINMALGLQLILSTTLTAVSAGGGSKHTITGISVINTIIAGQDHFSLSEHAKFQD